MLRPVPPLVVLGHVGDISKERKPRRSRRQPPPLAPSPQERQTRKKDKTAYLEDGEQHEEGAVSLGASATGTYFYGPGQWRRYCTFDDGRPLLHHACMAYRVMQFAFCARIGLAGIHSQVTNQCLVR